MKVLGGRNLILPRLNDFESMGLRRSHKYHCMTYAQLLEKLQISADPLRNATTSYAKKVRDYAQVELFIVANARPQQDKQPIHLSEHEHHSMNIGAEGLLENFAQFLYSNLNWILPDDGNVRPYITSLNELPEVPSPGDDYLQKIMQWVNRYGLLFNEPIDQSFIETIYDLHHLPFSDAVYRGICAEYGAVPYFMSVKAFCELNRYALKILFADWLYSQDSETRKNSLSDAATESESDSPATSPSCENILEVYRLLNPIASESLEEVAKVLMGDELAEETQYYRVRQHALRTLSQHMARWIRLELAAQLNPLAVGTEVSRYAIPLGEDKEEWFAESHYQCDSLFGCMMLEALSAVNKKSKYRTCEFCGKIFDIGKGRSDRKYCSDGTKLSYENCKKQARYKRQRIERSDAKLAAKGARRSI